MTTNFNDVMRQIEEEAEAEGQSAVNELKSLHDLFRMEREAIQRDLDQPCLIEAFFKRQLNLPMGMRATFSMISCPCPKCSKRK
jgi:hypothetical protein